MTSRSELNTKRSKALYGFALFCLVLLSTYWVYKTLNPKVGHDLASVGHTDTVIKPNELKPTLDVGTSPEALDKERYSTPNALINGLGALTLSGTQIDGAARTDANGNLILDQALRDYFDYFLSAADEIGPESAIQAAIDLINQSLPSEAAEQARGVFQRYLKYLSEQYKIGDQPLINQIDEDADALLVLRETSVKLRGIREDLFTEAESKALFGLEDANAEFTLKSLELLADESLDIEQQRSELERLQLELPESLRTNIETSIVQKDQQAEIQTLLDQKLDDGQLYDELRNLNLSDERAQDLLVYQQSQAYFEQQYARYQSAKAKLGDNPNNIDLISDFFTTPEAQTAARLRELGSQ